MIARQIDSSKDLDTSSSHRTTEGCLLIFFWLSSSEVVSPAGATEAGMMMPLWAPALQAQMQELALCKGHEANGLIMLLITGE